MRKVACAAHYAAVLVDDVRLVYALIPHRIVAVLDRSRSEAVAPQVVGRLQTCVAECLQLQLLWEAA